MLSKQFFCLILIYICLFQCCSNSNRVQVDDIPYEIYPEVNRSQPDLPSPFISTENDEYVVAVTKEEKYAIIKVTLSNDKEICKQLIMDTVDFPELVKTGLHSDKELNHLQSITGWSLDTITMLGRPESLSHSGFMAKDENVLAVIKADNRIVKKLKLTHPKLATPLFHVLNMMDMDLALKRWNMAQHQWENITAFNYNGEKVKVEAYDTKGGQQSIFNDSIEGSFYIKLWHEYDASELEYLNDYYGHLTSESLEAFKERLGSLNISEMQPQYIMRYGFYEGHTYWRACPIAISFIFGFKSLEELDNLFEGKLDEITTQHHIE